MCCILYKWIYFMCLDIHCYNNLTFDKKVLVMSEERLAYCNNNKIIKPVKSK